MSIAPKELKLCSPVGAEAIVYHWPLCRGKNYNGALEIVETIKLVCNECPELKIVADKAVSEEVDFSSYESMKTICDRFNKAATAYKNLNKGTSKFPVAKYASPTLLRHIVQQVYNRSVAEPEKLNMYEPFTPAVYGETSFDLIAKMIEVVKPSENDVFIDLGSGVGQVVIQVAGGAKCKKCIGIEKADVPNSYAKNVEYEFRKWMRWYGKSYSEFQLIDGDFLEPKYREMIMGCNLIFVNNFAFGPEVDHKLKQIFADMHDGTRIVSSKAFCPLNFRISDRNLSDIGTIMNVTELSSQTGNVSWTDKPVTYYLHTIDRKKLEEYFASIRNNGGGSGGNGQRPELRRSGSKASCQSWSSRDSGSSNAEFPSTHQPIAVEEQENIFVGTTTRRQYASWLAQQKTQRKESQPQRGSPMKQLSVVAKRLDDDAGSSSMQQPMYESSSENTEERENEVMDVEEDEHDDDDDDDEDEEDEEDEEPEETEDAARRKRRKSSSAQESFRRPGRPRKSHAALKAQQAKKKYQSQRQRRPGRPAVKKIPPKKKTQDWVGILDMFHQEITTFSGPSDHDAGDARMRLAGTPSHGTTVDHGQPSGMSAPATLPPVIDSALNEYIAQLKSNIHYFLNFMATPQYRAQVMELIERERARQRLLQDRVGQLERQISKMQEEGVQHLRARMAEVGIQAETPAELLNKAKEIVMNHQALQNRANNIDSDLRNLQKQNEFLVALCRERDEQVIRSGLLQSMGYSSGLSAEEAKASILREIGLLFNRRRALMVEMTRFENEIQTLESNMPPGTNTETLLSQLPSALPPVSTTPSSTSGAPAPVSAGASASSTTPGSPPANGGTPRPSTGQGTAAARKRGSASTPRRKSVVVKGARGKQKSTPAVTTPSTTTTTVSTAAAAPTTTATAEEGTQEDIEEKIRDIVRKALSVDNAAKKAEKERKARTAERKRGAKTTTTTTGAAPDKVQKPSQQGAGSATTKTASAKGTDSSQKGQKEGSSGLSAAITGIEQTISETISNFASSAAAVQHPSEERPHSRASSATESAPSDHEDFRTEDDSVSAPPPPPPATSREPAVSQKQPQAEPKTTKPRVKKTSVSAIKSAAVVDQQRPSSVPVSQSSAAVSQFSISSLIAAAAIDSATTAAQAPGSVTYPRVTSAFARIEHIPTTAVARTTLEETISSVSEATTADSGIAGSQTEPGSATSGPSTSSIPYPSSFTGASANVGQPGNPHSYSNPGNPVMEDFPKREEDDYSNPFKGTSNTGNAGNPHDYSNPGNPSTPEETDVIEPKALQPFRIPRRAVKGAAHDSPDTRSPLAQVGLGRKDEGGGSSWMPTSSSGLGVRKRRRDTDISPSKKRLMIADTTVTPFDQIMNTMIATHSGAPAAKKQSRSRSIHSDSSSGSRKKVEPFHTARTALLTKETLERHAACQEVHSFAEKGLMEALLEHKMMAGRIESHSQIANKLRFSPTKKKPAGPGTPPGSPRGTSSAAAPATGNRRGPKTPENTPPSSPSPSSHSRSSKRSNFSGVSALEQDSLSGQQPGSLAPQVSTGTVPASVTERRESRSPSTNANARTLETLARLTNIDAGQLAKCLNEDALQTLQDIDPALLVATLSTLLSTVVKSVNRPSASGSEAATSNRPATDDPNRSTGGRDKSEELVTSTSMVEDKANLQAHQPQLQPVEMDIDNSSHSESPAPPPEQPYGQKAIPDQAAFPPPPPPHPTLDPAAQFQPHQLFQPFFSLPPPAPLFMTPPPSGTMPPPPPPFFAPPPPPPESTAIQHQHQQQQQQQLLQNLFMLMQMVQGPMFNNALGGEDGLSSDSGMRDSTRFVKNYYHGDERLRCPSPEPLYTMPPPPKPVRVDYSFSTPRELAVIRAPPQPSLNDAAFFQHRPPTPPLSAPFHDPMGRPFPPQPPVMPMGPLPFGPPQLPMQPLGPGGIPSLLDMEPPCPLPPPPFGAFRSAPPPPPPLPFGRGPRGGRGHVRHFRP